MFEKIRRAISSHDHIQDWNIRRVRTREFQQYELRESTEAFRTAVDEKYLIEVLRENRSASGELTVGLGSAPLLTEAEIEGAVQQAYLTAGLVHNPPYQFPFPEEPPEVPLVDQALLDQPKQALEELINELKVKTGEHPEIRLSAAEGFGTVVETRLISSRGIDVEQTATNIYLQWVFMSGEGEQEVESFVELSRRRLTDLDLAGEVDRRAGYTRDLREAAQPSSYQGPVVVRGAALAEMVGSDVLRNLPSAALTFTGETPWKVGESIARDELKGEPLHCWANRKLPYGTLSSRFDKEGLPAQRVELIKDHQLLALTASGKYAEYLDVPATGAFGNLEIAPGSTPETDLIQAPFVEVAEFSWFNPNPMTGDFSSEIRLGYAVDQHGRKPFRGGLLVGNLLDALSDVTWSEETGFFGSYQGPRAARFNQLQVAGQD
jgi:PmbA protein